METQHITAMIEAYSTRDIQTCINILKKFAAVGAGLDAALTLLDNHLRAAITRMADDALATTMAPAAEYWCPHCKPASPMDMMVVVEGSEKLAILACKRCRYSRRM